MIVATWNTEWRSTQSGDAGEIRNRLHSVDPEIVCLTETHIDFLAEWGGHTIVGTDDWGGPTYETRREVLLWSRNPWRNVDRIGSTALPPGRFARATTQTSLGAIEVVGVVIPYHMANVRNGRRDKKLWELHQQYLDGLPVVTSALGPKSILLGDYNQRVPSKWVPKICRETLSTGLGSLTLATSGPLAPDNWRAIDHIAIGSDLSPDRVGTISNLKGRRQISDHFGVWADLSLTNAK